MRNKKKAFLSCAIVAGGLLAATGVMATGGGSSTPTPPPSPLLTSCTAGKFDVKVSSGPSFVSCPYGQCTEIEYEVKPVAGTNWATSDHVAALQGIGIQYATGNKWYQPCEGDYLTGLGVRSCHEQVARFNPNASVQKFKIGLAGQRKSGPTTIATKKGSTYGQCRILGIGLEGVASPGQSTAAAECSNFKGCVVCFEKDAATGDVSSAYLNRELSPKLACDEGGPANDCCSDVLETSVDKLSLTLNVPGFGNLGAGQIGDGYISSGSNSCTTRVIGGRVYTWGDPCPE